MGREDLDDVDDGGPLWDPRVAVELIGRRVLVGVTDLTVDGVVLGRSQFHGHAIRADRCGGIALRLGGARAGQEIVLPPDTRAFRRAPPGEYRLHDTGEAVERPDFLTTWSVQAER